MAWEWVAPVTTLAAGVAGIAGTVIAARYGRLTQLELARMAPAQALLAEKRLSYAKFLRGADELLGGMRRIRRIERLRSRSEEVEGTPEESRVLVDLNEALEGAEDLRDHLLELQKDLGGIRQELTVLSGFEIGALAARALAVVSRIDGTDEEWEARALAAVNTLAFTMHIDTNPLSQDIANDVKSKVAATVEDFENGVVAEHLNPDRSTSP
ncbi:hypothetical protein [Paractinoplanes rishiriensis]|uniref:Uncharacterized protein n=1 Tax=Paractinoplanes rishiriensis TaxID=1050105 RepID=A0A919MX35_9ACTN|nr:hypothetical protein [Actinoplanes rishiriensis]GIE98094.1 hypothetical protein Ari01nite_55590 [Actinoplanes rishiriensis]